jgi:hypothetical protein
MISLAQNLKLIFTMTHYLACIFSVAARETFTVPVDLHKFKTVPDGLCTAPFETQTSMAGICKVAATFFL